MQMRSVHCALKSLVCQSLRNTLPVVLRGPGSNLMVFTHDTMNDLMSVIVLVSSCGSIHTRVINLLSNMYCYLSDFIASCCLNYAKQTSFTISIQLLGAVHSL